MTEIKEQLSQLNKMSNKSEALYHKVAFSIGISDSSLGVLYTLLDAEAPCSQYDLCSEWSIPKQTINPAVAALQKKGVAFLSPIPGTRNKGSSNFMVDSPKSILFLLLPKCPQTQTRSL